MFKVTKPHYNHMGFTLAETLITLVIIGVVAALTVPTLIVKHQKEDTVTKLKKTYSTLSQAANRAIADNGPIRSWEVEEGQTKEFVDKYIAPYLNVGKDCGYETTGDCHFEYAPMNNESNKTVFGNDYYKLILNDGIVLVFKTRTSLSRSNGKWIHILVSDVDIDLNGQKGPNVYGKDIFNYVYWIKAENNLTTITPNGGFGDREYFKTIGCSKEGYGDTCTGLIMADGWQIRDDYPW